MDTKKKNPKNMERYKTLFFEAGLVVSLFIVLAAFEWKSAPVVSIVPEDKPYQYVISDTLITYKQKETPPPPKTSTEIKITNKEVLIDPDMFDPEWNKEPILPVFEKIVIEPITGGDVDTGIIIVPPVMPQFPGGEAALGEYMQNNLHYPASDREIGLQGKVYVTFVVEKNGAVSQVSLQRGIGGQCDGEALRVVNNMPNWVPGKNSLGRPVRVKLTLPVNFKLVD